MCRMGHSNLKGKSCEFSIESMRLCAANYRPSIHLPLNCLWLITKTESHLQGLFWNMMRLWPVKALWTKNKTVLLVLGTSVVVLLLHIDCM